MAFAEPKKTVTIREPVEISVLTIVLPSILWSLGLLLKSVLASTGPSTVLITVVSTVDSTHAKEIS